MTFNRSRILGWSKPAPENKIIAVDANDEMVARPFVNRAGDLVEPTYGFGKPASVALNKLSNDDLAVMLSRLGR